MDTVATLVQGYLHVNGYFTAAGYPVLEVHRDRQARTVTELDILAYRFAGAGHDLIRVGGYSPMRPRVPTVGPAPGAPVDRGAMILGEVKEGAARSNPALRDRVKVALTRFGRCPPGHTGC